MRVFLAGATGVIGIRLLPLLAGAEHEVAGITRSRDKTTQIEALGARPVVCDVFDTASLLGAVSAFAPDLAMHQLTDLPDERDEIPRYAEANNRIRTEGTRNLLTASAAAGAGRFLAQSIAWTPSGSGDAVAEHERPSSMPAVSSSATASSTGRTPITPTTSPRRLGSTSTTLPGVPWRSSTHRAGSWCSPTRMTG